MKRAMRLVVAGALLAGAVPAFATMDLGKKAKEAGFAEAGKCSYCHGEAMPKKGSATYNDRGKFLGEQKASKKATAVDVTWLKDYVEKK